jgi:hypothetical protein
MSGRNAYTLYWEVWIRSVIFSAVQTTKEKHIGNENSEGLFVLLSSVRKSSETSIDALSRQFFVFCEPSDSSWGRMQRCVLFCEGDTDRVLQHGQENNVSFMKRP